MISNAVVMRTDRHGHERHTTELSAYPRRDYAVHVDMTEVCSRVYWMHQQETAASPVHLDLASVRQ